MQRRKWIEIMGVRRKLISSNPLASFVLVVLNLRVILTESWITERILR